MRLVDKDERILNQAAYAACFLFLGQCRKRVEHVREVYHKLSDLRQVLIKAWKRERARVGDRVDAAGLEDIRQSVSELESLLTSYQTLLDE